MAESSADSLKIGKWGYHPKSSSLFPCVIYHIEKKRRVTVLEVRKVDITKNTITKEAINATEFYYI